MPLNRKMSVIGLGYVGLPVAVAFGRLDTVIGFDSSHSRIAELCSGIDSTKEVSNQELQYTNICYTSEPDQLHQADFYIVAVPTPVNEAKQPDLTSLLSATESVGRALKRGDIVVYESTVYPGCTEEDCVPILERTSGLEFNVDFGVGYSPERINPGDNEHKFTQIKKVVSGSNPEVTDIIAEVYASVISAGIYQASSLKVAEAAKVIENAQRDLNIAFVNELALIFNQLDIDTHEVLEAAGTKWNFLPFQPGLVGGHCIGVDPYYLTHRAQRAGYHPQMILAGRNINDNMGAFIAQQTVRTLASAGIVAVEAIVTVLGLTFKEDCPDLRNSKVTDILNELSRYGCKLQINDPLCSPQEAREIYGVSLCENSNLKPAHGVVLAVAHQTYRKWSLENWESLIVPGGVFIDVKNITPANQLQSSGYHVWKL